MNASTATACPNIAFIKYWGNRDAALRLPANGSLSMNLGGLWVRTRVQFDSALLGDSFMLNRRVHGGAALQRVSRFLDEIRRLAGIRAAAQVESANNFPMGVGVASSAAAFAALAVAGAAAAGLSLNEAQLSRLARLGSGSACRSVPGGFVEWQTGSGDPDSYAFSIAAPGHWAVVDCIAMLTQVHKEVGSTEGHALAPTSPLQAARLADTPRRLDLCRAAILQRDFAALAEVIEEDSTIMHAVMMTSRPPLFYWQPESLAVMQAVRGWRKAGLPCAFTLDAGPNVHVLCEATAAGQVQARLAELPGVQSVLVAPPGAAAMLMKE